MRELDEIIDGENVPPRTFHPVHDQGPGAWFPGNEAAALLVQACHILEDIGILREVYFFQTEKYRRQLTLKYVVIEVRSLIQVFDRLATITMRTPVFNPNERQGWREITQEERDKTAALLKEYSKAKSQVSKMIIEVRNEVAAHRSNIDWQEVRKFWGSISPELVNPILSTVPPAYDHIKNLDIFEWNRVHEDGIHEFISSQIRPEYFNLKERDET